MVRKNEKYCWKNRSDHFRHLDLLRSIDETMMLGVCAIKKYHENLLNSAFK